MNTLKYILIAIAALALATGCTPKRAPGQGYTPSGNEPALDDVSGETAGVDEGDIGDDAPGASDLTDADTRESTPADDQVANWIANNSIPEDAKIATIYFEFDKFAVSAENRNVLDGLVDKIPTAGVYIVGYTDYIGTTEYNLTLSDKRAQSVKNYLNEQGAAKEAKIQAMGEQYAVQSGTKEEVAQDRKVIIVDGNYRQ